MKPFACSKLRSAGWSIGSFGKRFVEPCSDGFTSRYGAFAGLARFCGGGGRIGSTGAGRCGATLAVDAARTSSARTFGGGPVDDITGSGESLPEGSFEEQLLEGPPADASP